MNEQMSAAAAETVRHPIGENSVGDKQEEEQKKAAAGIKKLISKVTLKNVRKVIVHIIWIILLILSIRTLVISIVNRDDTGSKLNSSESSVVAAAATRQIINDVLQLQALLLPIGEYNQTTRRRRNNLNTTTITLTNPIRTTTTTTTEATQETTASTTTSNSSNAESNECLCFC